jgi:hypothetical protein
MEKYKYGVYLHKTKAIFAVLEKPMYSKFMTAKWEVFMQFSVPKNIYKIGTKECIAVGTGIMSYAREESELDKKLKNYEYLGEL